MALANCVAERFWESDLRVIEQELGIKISSLSPMEEERRVPSQGTVLAFSVANISQIVDRPSIKLLLLAAFYRIKRIFV